MVWRRMAQKAMREGTLRVGRVAQEVHQPWRSQQAGPSSPGKAKEQQQRLNKHRDFFPGQQYQPSDLQGTPPPGTTRPPPRSSPTEAHKSTARRVDFRNARSLSNFLSHHGKLLRRRKTGLKAKVHRSVGREIKLARDMALLPHVGIPPRGSCSPPPPRPLPPSPR